MTTYTLLIFLAYAGSSPEIGGGVALDNQRVEFFSAEECRDAKKAVDQAIKTEGFRRSITVCVKRGAALLQGAER